MYKVTNEIRTVQQKIFGKIKLTKFLPKKAFMNFAKYKIIISRNFDAKIAYQRAVIWGHSKETEKNYKKKLYCMQFKFFFLLELFWKGSRSAKWGAGRKEEKISLEAPVRKGVSKTVTI